MRSREEQREEERKYQGDVEYEVWKRGGNPDRVDRERVEDHFHDGLYPEESASREIRRIYPPHPPEELPEEEPPP